MQHWAEIGWSRNKKKETTARIRLLRENHFCDVILVSLLTVIFLNWHSLHARLNSPRGMELQEKEVLKKIKAYMKKV